MGQTHTLITPVKGTRDFYPEEMAFHRWLHHQTAEVSQSFGYLAYDGPFLERIELYAAKSGDELVQQQAFVLTDRGGERLCLRPELTPTLARMIAQKQKALRFPVRWFSFGPFWRYEKPQRGRSREFFQWNIDLLGVDAIAGDAEIIAVGANLLRNLGLTPDQVVIKVSSRRWMSAQLETIGIPADRQQAMLHLIDRRDKLSSEAWSEQARESGLTGNQQSGLLSALEDADGWKRDADLIKLMDEVAALGVGDFVEFDPGIVRGLDYYTGVVFEAKDRDGKFRSILGGGRYDNLVAIVGGQPVPGVGFAMGDVVIRVVLEHYDRMPHLKTSPADALVTVFNDDLRHQTVEIATEMRRHGIAIEMSLASGKLRKQMKRADLNDIPWVVICGPDELANGQVNLKHMPTGEQIQLPLSEAIERIKASSSESP